jgi:dolichyl-phosphate beta-glucosyltransferase
MKPYLSIIIPAFNEETRLKSSLIKIANYLNKQSYTYEVLIIENGSNDRTLEIAQDFSYQNPQFIAIHEDQNGKGRAVRRGMLEAKGNYRFMCDADLSMPIEELSRFLPPEIDNPSIVIASREVKDAIRYDEPDFRHLGGRLINLIIRIFAIPGIQDTQCGFKLFEEELAKDLFEKQRIMGWAMDVELLYIANKLGYEIIELPIPWYFSPDSKVSPVKDSIQMFIDILKIRRNYRKGLYGQKKI